MKKAALVLLFLLFLSLLFLEERGNQTQAEEKPSFIPLGEQKESLMPLDTKEPVWVSKDRTKVILGGTICLREGLLEFFACRERTKEHESIVVLPIKPHLIHAALLVIGAKQGRPAQFNPVFVPPSGAQIEILVRWQNKEGKTEEKRAQEWVREAKSHKEMNVPWVFTGGLFGKNANGNKYYLADLSGEIIGVSNFPGSVLDIPMESTADNDNLVFEPNTEKIPPLGTPVTLILSKRQE